MAYTRKNTGETKSFQRSIGRVLLISIATTVLVVAIVALGIIREMLSESSMKTWAMISIALGGFTGGLGAYTTNIKNLLKVEAIGCLAWCATLFFCGVLLFKEDVNGLALRVLFVIVGFLLSFAVNILRIKGTGKHSYRYKYS